MRLSIRAGALILTALLGFGLGGAHAAEREAVLLKDQDLPGFDYLTLKDITLPQCQQACEGDNICYAFTFNQKAKWCFLKSTAGEPAPFKGATSGTIKQTPDPATTAVVRAAELPFPAQDLVQGAKNLAAGMPDTDMPPKDLAYADLVGWGDQAVESQNWAGASVSYRQALALNANDGGLWLKLAQVNQSRGLAEREQGNSTYEFASTASYAAINAFLRADPRADRATALDALAQALELREMWRESIATYRLSVALVDDTGVQARLDKVVAEHGFRVVSNDVNSESASPSICVNFSDPLRDGGNDLSSYVVVDGAAQAAIETSNAQICIEGLEHGKRYGIRLRAGLPSQYGEELRADVDLSVYVPDRSPFVGFANTAYVMPAGLGGGLPITSINAETADVVIYRIGDRSIASAVRNGIFQGSMDGYRAEDVANQYGQQVWEGQVKLAEGARNALSTTAVPVADILGTTEPGAYVVTARVAGLEENYWDYMATQWFIVTDLGLTTVSGEDGVHAFIRSLSTARPVADASVRLIAVNNEILGEARTDADGRAVFAPGLARGEGGRAPQLIVAETADGDYAFLDATRPAFDLTDRGVAGRPSPGPLDLFATTERGVYRPGETVFLTALLRDVHAKAVKDLALTLQVERPDGVLATTQIVNDRGAGSYFAAIPMSGDAMRGSWHIRLYADPKAEALSDTAFLVEDFEPERLAFEVAAPEGPMPFDAATEMTVAAKYLYGATAPDLAIEADAIIRPTTALAGFPGYTFGRLDDTIQTNREPLGVVGTTDADGNATVEISLPVTQGTTRPLEAQVLLRLVDTNGRAVERSVSRPVGADGDRIGVKPAFNVDNGLEEGANATFDVIAVAPQGEAVAKTGLKWTLSRIETQYQWYRQSDTWKWEAITTTHEVANGSVDAVAGGPVTVSAPVKWGRYQFAIESTGENPTSTSYEFYAGYYYVEAGSDTPDKLQVALDKPAYRAGETANLRLDPQFAGTALVMVVDNRIVSMQAVEVPAEGTTVALPVTEDWGPGAYVSAVFYRPSNSDEKRMPARALGLAYADVDPGDMQLQVAVEAPRETLPRQAFTARVKLANVQAGQQAYVAVAAVDLGILNLTRFKTPDPDGWFFGQRELGVEFRDLYGLLIDPTQGLPGEVRSGGDEAAARTGTPPPTSVLVALHSDIVSVDADGTATVTFDMPDFAGTVRLMVMAWTDTALGHAEADVIVRDPVVVTMSPPRFLRLDDNSRLLVEINNVSGAAGSYKVALETGEGIVSDATETMFNLAAGERTALNLGLTGTGIGNHEVRLTVTGPDGLTLTKQLLLGVRAASGFQTVSEVLPIAPDGSVTLDAGRFDTLVPYTGTITLAVGPLARLDVPGLLYSLDRYPYGCAEQTTSRALPLLYLNEVAEMIGLGDDEALAERVRAAIRSILAKQTSSGSFGLWGPSSYTDLWLDAYVTDFLLRAKAGGHDVPELAMTMALDNLSNQLSYASDFSNGGEDIAYALYDLAKAGRAAIGDLRYYLEAKLGAFATPLAQAQLGAALALYGDRTRADMAFAAALEKLSIVPKDRYAYRSDYGSRLRDTAGVLALAAEVKPSGVDLAALTQDLADLRDKARYTSTQEDAWTLLAAAALGRDSGDGAITLNGEALGGAVYRSYSQAALEAGDVTVTNNGNRPTEAKVTLTGIPAAPPPATEAGFRVERSYYLPDGTEADLTDIRQNDRFVVYLRVTPTELGSGNYLLVDPLPAGFEIENPDLSAGSGVADMSWLSFSGASHVESRTDQYVAAFRYSSPVEVFSSAYLVRAVSPGTFVMPGATVEDMYRPELRGNTDAEAIEVLPTGTPAPAAAAGQKAPAENSSGKSLDQCDGCRN